MCSPYHTPSSPAGTTAEMRGLAGPPDVYSAPNLGQGPTEPGGRVGSGRWAWTPHSGVPWRCAPVSPGPSWGSAPQSLCHAPCRRCSLLAAATHSRMTLASSARASRTDVGSNGWDALRSRHVLAESLSMGGRPEAHPLQPMSSHGPRLGAVPPPRAGPYLRSR